MFCTVSKCGSGLDDKTLDDLQSQLDMVKISKDLNKVPSWLNIKKQVGRLARTMSRKCREEN
jgi:DNA ligase-3